MAQPAGSALVMNPGLSPTMRALVTYHPPRELPGLGLIVPGPIRRQPVRSIARVAAGIGAWQNGSHGDRLLRVPLGRVVRGPDPTDPIRHPTRSQHDDASRLLVACHHGP